jgi:DNA recombination protein RmuC
MLILVIVLQITVRAAVLVLFLRVRNAGSAAGQDSRQAQVPDQLARLHDRHESNHLALDTNLRSGLSDLRREAGAEALSTRESNTRGFAELRAELMANIATLGQQLHGGLTQFRTDNAESSASLRREVLGTLDTLGGTLKGELGTFRADNKDAGVRLHGDVHAQHEAARLQQEGLAQRLGAAAAEARNDHAQAREALDMRLTGLDDRAKAHADRLLGTVQERLDALNASNAAKLEEMRVIVDEKLQATLNERLTHSFGQVTTHLGEVQKGLGEMKELATGVGDLKKVLSNVKSRGVVGEFQLGQQLEQMFSPEQYLKNAAIKPNSAERVEYALKFPAGEPGAYTLLPIDAKFPKEDWERLEHAYEHGTADEIATAGKAFERAIRAEGKRICEKYIDPPTTLPHGIMFLPTEGLYAEVVRRPGLQSEIQSNCSVTIAGPSTFMAILTSFQMGFHTLAIQKKGDEVWRVLSGAKNEFEKFGGLMDKVRKQVDTVQNTLGEIGGKTRTINRALKNVSILPQASLDSGAGPSNLLNFEELAGVAPLLAAAGEEE